MKKKSGQCPMCGGKYLKAIYMGLPLRICADDSCACAEGLALWAMENLPLLSETEIQAGGWALFTYEGNYLQGLWGYLTR